MALVGSFPSRSAAELAAGMLRARGLRAVVSADDAGGIVPNVALGQGGWALSVADDDLEEAVALLDQVDDGGAPPRPAGSTARRSGRAWPTVGELVAALVLVLAAVAHVLLRTSG